MSKRLFIIFTCVFTFLICHTENAFSNNNHSELWSSAKSSIIQNSSEHFIKTQRHRLFDLDHSGMRILLESAPNEKSISARHSNFILSLPMPDGSFNRFSIVESPIMDPVLSAKFPEIKTFAGQGIDDVYASVRIDITPAGFHAMILSNNQTVYIDPCFQENNLLHKSYYKKDILQPNTFPVCNFDISAPENAQMRIELFNNATESVKLSGFELRTYRLALASTGEYTAYHGGTVASGLAAMVTAMNRVNGVYEREVAIRMTLVANNNLLVYTNSSSDPYTNNNGGTMLGQNQTNLDAIIGNANYDIGHVFSTGGGGIANLACVCNAGTKGRGVTGSPTPNGDGFFIDYVAHEMGHQFGGNHTFNGTAGSCSGGNRNASTAYEPGSGSTIMGYAGICGSHDLQNFSNDYFHNISFNELINYSVFNAGNNCPLVTPTNNNPPVVIGCPDYTIPYRTPFILTASGSDADGDPITYCWEEMDLGPGGAPNSASGNAPLFRSFSPTPDSTRTFPRLSNIIANTQTIGELLPSYARTMNFRVTVRDNRIGGGGVTYNNPLVKLTVINTAAPFLVTYPNTNITWNVNDQKTVTWDVVGTDQPPINTSLVNIRLSTNGGQTFPIVLAANVPNNGAYTVTVPNNLTTTARVKVEAVGNIFFDMSNTNFTIAPVGTGISNNIFSGNVEVFPNPSNDFARVIYNDSYFGNVKIMVIDLLGKDILITQSQKTLPSFEHLINTGIFEKGIYFIMIETSEGVYTHKLVKE